MIDTEQDLPREKLNGSLRQTFTEGAAWPVDMASLTALIDLGLSVKQIAAYFSVSPADVLWLADTYGLSRSSRNG